MLINQNWQRLKQKGAIDAPNPKKRSAKAMADQQRLARKVVKIAMIEAQHRHHGSTDATDSSVVEKLEETISVVTKQDSTSSPLYKLLAPPSSTFSLDFPIIAIDCEFVGVGREGREHMLARCSIVDYYGTVLYDKYVLPTEKITQYRTEIHGITPEHLSKVTNPELVEFKECQKAVNDLLKGKILVGHAVHHDLAVLLLSHPKSATRDTSRSKILNPRRHPKKLSDITAEHLNINIQKTSHDSVEDARAAIALYRKYRDEWEKYLQKKPKPSESSESTKTLPSSTPKFSKRRHKK